MELDNDAAGEELAGEVEQVRVVEQDQELGEPSLVERHGGIVHESAVLCRGCTTLYRGCCCVRCVRTVTPPSET